MLGNDHLDQIWKIFREHHHLIDKTLTMDNDMHIMTLEFKDKELMKTYKIGAKLGSNELTTKLQQLSKESQRKAE